MVKDSGVAVRLDSVAVEFDDERLVANAGVLLTSTLVKRLGVERLVDETVDLGQRAGAARPGRKVCSLVHAIVLGADSIDDLRRAALGGHWGAAWASRAGAVDARYLPALVQLRACAPA